uniref:ATP synthase complex subunit 8 n=1 Tax=Anthocharis bambusarum TaxID=385382 RepID=A0A088B0Y7_ANTBA|nr:ATP synthase F0 subunit 8 [Anthocharis bambusarum]AGG40671.1 ATP synthase F0 subunit 8 [Anthocharis bambusarum]
MPQMMPINWIFYFFYFLMIFMMFNIMNYYIYFNFKLNQTPKNFQFKKKKINWKW